MSEQATADWRTMEAGRELDRVVAERLGWRIDIENGDVYDEKGDYIPSDNPYGESREIGYTENELWGRCSHYSTDANAALALYDGCRIELKAEPPDDWTCFLVIESPVYGEWRGEADTAALAIVRAWLAWKDAQ